MTTLGRYGVWLAPVGLLRDVPVPVELEQVRRIEELGYGSVWIGESTGPSRELLAHLGVLLAATDRMVIGAGVAVASVRAASVLRAGTDTLAAAYPGRLVLGIGTGFGQPYEHPIRAIGQYLDEFEDAEPGAPVLEPYPRVLAALGPRMLDLARARVDGAHTYSMPVQHTRLAREALGTGKLLVTEQSVIDQRDASAVRAMVRGYLGHAPQDNPYARRLLRLGYTTEDLRGSDRFIADRFAYGEDEAIVQRLDDHLEAGADTVLLHVLAGELGTAVDTLERLKQLLRATA